MFWISQFLWGPGWQFVNVQDIFWSLSLVTLFLLISISQIQGLPEKYLGSGLLSNTEVTDQTPNQPGKFWGHSNWHCTPGVARASGKWFRITVLQHKYVPVLCTGHNEGLALLTFLNNLLWFNSFQRRDIFCLESLPVSEPMGVPRTGHHSPSYARH